MKCTTTRINAVISQWCASFHILLLNVRSTWFGVKKNYMKYASYEMFRRMTRDILSIAHNQFNEILLTVCYSKYTINQIAISILVLHIIMVVLETIWTKRTLISYAR